MRWAWQRQAKTGHFGAATPDKPRDCGGTQRGLPNNIRTTLTWFYVDWFLAVGLCVGVGQRGDNDAQHVGPCSGAGDSKGLHSLLQWLVKVLQIHAKLFCPKPSAAVLPVPSLCPIWPCLPSPDASPTSFRNARCPLLPVPSSIWHHRKSVFNIAHQQFRPSATN